MPLNIKRLLYDKNHQHLIYLFISVGILFRLYHFFYNRSLWMDEIYLSTSLIKFDYSDLINTPLSYQQKAPIGFLIVVKFFVNVFGRNEYSLRLFPLISGICSIFAFAGVSKFFLKGVASITAIGLICVMPAVVYHSVEIKQYSTELFCSILSFYLMTKFYSNYNIKSMLVWGLLGATILWFSFSSVFILAGIGLALSVSYIIKKEWKKLIISALPFFLWGFSFTINYVLFTQKQSGSNWTEYWFNAYKNFMPLPPLSFRDLLWFPINLYRMLDYPLGQIWSFMNLTSNHKINIFLKLPFIAIILLTSGFLYYLKYSKKHFLILVIPIILMSIASGLHFYPLTERFWLFIVPNFIIILVAGFNFLSSKLKSKKIKFLILILMFINPVTQLLEITVNPDKFYAHKRSYQREMLLYINKNYQPDDIVYVYWNNLPGYRFYEKILKLKYTAIQGSDFRHKSKNLNEYNAFLNTEFSKFSNKKRIWIIYNTQFLTDIGDLIDQPTWYYTKDPNKHLISQLQKKYIFLKKYSRKDVTIELIELRN